MSVKGRHLEVLQGSLRGLCKDALRPYQVSRISLDPKKTEYSSTSALSTAYISRIKASHSEITESTDASRLPPPTRDHRVSRI